MKLLKMAAAGLALLSLPLSAALNGHPVVLVHGFQPGNLADRPVGADVTNNGADYWAGFWLSRADARIDWPSQERIAGKIATDYVWPKLQQLSRAGTCNTGCIFVSHSTGDLVTRYIIDNQALWLKNAGLQPLNIIASFDFAGAGGGVELADLAVNVAGGGSWTDAALRAALSLWLGQMPSPSNIGVLNDLRVNTARQLASFPTSRVPRLRFAGAGSDFLNATGPFLPGTDDGVVASHSSCGASAVGSFDSCSGNVAFDGKLASQSSGVKGFMPYHYPMLMGNDYSHSGLIEDSRDGEVTAANARANYLNAEALQFQTYQQKRGWWVFASNYLLVTGSDRQSMSSLVSQAAD